MRPPGRRDPTLASDAVSVSAAALERPYAPSWVDRLLDGIERLPGPTPLAYLVLGAATVLLMHAEPWAMGQASPWTAVEKTYWGAMIGAQLGVIAYLRRVAGSAFDAFRPALPLLEPELARLRYQLTVIPAGPALWATGAGIALSAVSLAVDPSATGTLPLTGSLLVAAFVLQAWISAVIAVLLLQLLRQMRQIQLTLARSAVVDVFRPGPLNAFSRLTARTGIILVLLIASTLLVVPIPTDLGALLVGWLPYLVLPPSIAAAAFVLPLHGMHGRLVAEKERLQWEAEERLQRLFAEINRDVDARDISRADALNKTLASLLQQRDVLAKLPTWPWSAGTLRAFVTAIFLPLVLFLLQRVLSQVV